MTIQSIEDSYLVPMYAKRDVAMVRGEGAYLIDDQGNHYLDLMSAYGAALLGHAHPALVETISSQVKQLANCHHSFYNDVRAKFIVRFSELVTAGFGDHLTDPYQLFFTNSGTESVEAALKFARVITGKSGVVAAKQSYHGRTMGALSVTGQRKYQQPYEPMLLGAQHVPFNDIDALEEAIDETVGAVILEPIQGEGGIVIPSEGYLAAVREICDENRVLLIFDEIQTCYRTGSYLFAHQVEVIPDLIAVSKAIAGGLPMGLTLVKPEWTDLIPTTTHGNTFGASPLICAAALAVLETIEKTGLHDRVLGAGKYLLSGLIAANHPLIRDIRGRGLMIAVELRQKTGRYVKALQAAGFLVIPTGATTIRLLPPLIITEAQIDDFLIALVAVLNQE